MGVQSVSGKSGSHAVSGRWRGARSADVGEFRIRHSAREISANFLASLGHPWVRVFRRWTLEQTWAIIRKGRGRLVARSCGQKEVVLYFRVPSFLRTDPIDDILRGRA